MANDDEPPIGAGSGHRLGDAPIEDRYRKQMNELAGFLDRLFNDAAHRGAPGHARTTGFVLMVFPFGDSGRCNYISNANRPDVVTMLKEQIRRFEGAPDRGRGQA